MKRAWLFAILVGCGTARPTRIAHPAPPIVLEALIPEDAEWVVLARPAELWRSAAVRVALAPAITAPDLHAFAERTGVDLTAVSELTAAGFGLRGELLAVRERDARKSMRRALALTGEPQYQILPLERDVVLVGAGAGAPGLLDAGRARRSRAAGLTGVARGLRGELPEAPFHLLYLAPVFPDRDTEAAVLLSGVRGAAVAVRPQGAEIVVSVVLRGDFPSTAAENFRIMLASVAGSSLGEVFGLAEFVQSARIQATSDRVTLEIEVPAQAVADGVRTLFVARLQELLQGTSDAH